MSRESLVFVLGFVVLMTPFIGIPRDWKETIFIGIGILLMLLGYSLRRSSFLRSIEMGNGERRSDAFVENTSVENLEEPLQDV